MSPDATLQPTRPRSASATCARPTPPASRRSRASRSTSRPGDFFALLGPNGAGKSTLIGIVSSLVNKTAGEVARLRRRPRARPRRRDAPDRAGAAGTQLQPVREALRHPGATTPASTACRAQRRCVRAEEELKRAQLWDKAHVHVAHAVGRHEAPPDDRARDDDAAAPADPRRAHRRRRHRDPPRHVEDAAARSTPPAPRSSSPRITSRRPRSLCRNLAIIDKRHASSSRAR